MILLTGRPLYVAVSSAFTPGATPQDIFTITGSASKTIEVVEMGLSATQTTAGINAWFARKRSTANSGGTSTAPTLVPVDSKLPTATATVLQYTLNPTAGTLVGDVWAGFLSSPAPATAGIGAAWMSLDFINTQGHPIYLRGINEVLAWNFNGAALPAGLSVLAYVVWGER